MSEDLTRVIGSLGDYDALRRAEIPGPALNFHIDQILLHLLLLHLF